jgi:hypothetical protein
VEGPRTAHNATWGGMVRLPAESRTPPYRGVGAIGRRGKGGGRELKSRSTAERGEQLPLVNLALDTLRGGGAGGFGVEGPGRRENGETGPDADPGTVATKTAG